jgi:hypothetical protein
MDGEQDRADARIVDGDLEDGAVPDARRDPQRQRQPPLDRALAVAAVAVEQIAARALADVACRDERHVERQHAAARGFPRGQQDLAGQAPRLDRTADVAEARTARE